MAKGEEGIYKAAASGLKRWLGKARDAVMAPWRQYKVAPDPGAIASTVPVWQAEVDRIMAELSPALREGWAAAHLPGDYDPDDPFIQSNLALTHNLLVRIPDEVHAKVVAQILEGANEGESTEQIAQRVDNVLDYTGSENWPARARLIAVTEGTRHYNSSILAHALMRQREDGGMWVKEWQTKTDGKERPEHHAADHQRRPLEQPYIVGGSPMLFPGDPSAPADLVCNCVPPWQQISVRATASMVRCIDGVLINLSTAAGNKLSATPNHPVLTSRGWAPIGTIKPGDHVLCCSKPDSTTSSIDPDVADCISTAEQVSSFIKLMALCPEGVSATLVDFDGNVIDEKVNVKGSNDVLSFGIYAQELEQLGGLGIHWSDGKVGFAPHLPSVELVEKSDAVGLASGSLREAKVSQRSYNTIASDAQFLRHRHNRDTPFIQFGDMGRQTSTDLGVSTRIQTMLLEGFINDPQTYAQVAGDTPGRQALMMETQDLELILYPSLRSSATTWQRVTSISRIDYVGPVYDFETVDGVFAAGGVVISNCRCHQTVEMLK